MAALRQMKMATRLELTAFLFIGPFIIYTIIFRFIPMLASLYLSFTNYNILTAPQWLGIQNYIRIMTSDPLFWTAFGNTIQYALEVLPFNIAISLSLALLVNQKIRGMFVFRTIFYLPTVTSIIAVSMIWLWLYNWRMGLFNMILASLGFNPVDWLGNPDMALHSLVIMRVWKGVGWNMIIYLAGLQGIPLELYEAAKIDGAGAWRQFRYITFPLLRPITLYIIIMGINSTLQTFGEIYAMTQGGPLDSTLTVGYLIYQQAFDYFEMGRASATSFVLFVVILVLSLINARSFRQVG